MGYSLQFRKFLGHKVLIETARREQFIGVLAGEDKWFLYLENVEYTTKEDSEHLRAATVHKARISLVFDLGQGEAGGGDSVELGQWA